MGSLALPPVNVRATRLAYADIIVRLSLCLCEEISC